MHEHHHPVSSTTPQPEPFEDAAQRPRKRKRYDAHERADCIRRWRQSGRPLDALAEEYQVAVSSIHRWIWIADRHQQTEGGEGVAVGTALTGRPPHRSGRALLTHPAPASGQTIKR